MDGHDEKFGGRLRVATRRLVVRNGLKGQSSRQYMSIRCIALNERRLFVTKRLLYQQQGTSARARFTRWWLEPNDVRAQFEIGRRVERQHRLLEENYQSDSDKDQSRQDPDHHPPPKHCGPILAIQTERRTVCHDPNHQSIMYRRVERIFNVFQMG